MLHIYFGNDTVTVQEKAHDFVRAQKQKGATVVHIDADRYVPGLFADLAGATSLFGETHVYLLDNPSQKKEMYDDTLAHLALFAESAHMFVIIEEALLVAEKKKFAKYATVAKEYKKKDAERFNTFKMADALSQKNKKQLWLQLQQAKQAGVSPEEIIGTLWWQLKTLRLARQTASAKEAGMKDYPYTKAKRALSLFKEGELEALSQRLLRVYHEGHGGQVAIDDALEHFVLTLK